MDSKLSEAGIYAQQLSSQRSWADTMAPQAPRPAVDIRSLQHNIDSGESDMAIRAPKTGDAPPTYQETVGVNHAELPGSIPDQQLITEGGENVHDTLVTRIPSAAINSHLPEPAMAEPVQPRDPARSYIRHEQHALITGTFTVLDYLDLSVVHGAISIALDPRPGEGPVVIKLEATYGAIKVDLSDRYLKQISDDPRSQRPWDVTIRSKHGAVHAQLPLGNGSKYFLKSRVGAIHSTFYAVTAGPEDAVSDIKTETHRGVQKICVKSLQPERTFSAITADFHAKEHGSLDIEYPKSWTGRIEASVARGKAKIKGKYLDVQPFGKQEKRAQRGSSTNTTILRCDGAGSAKIEC